VKDEVKSDRLQRLQDLLNRQTDAFNRASVGRRLPILLERPGRHHGQLVGRTPYLQAVHVEAPDDVLGDLIEVEIIEQFPHSLAATPVLAERSQSGSVGRPSQETFA
jgi:tRNA-2-methylthio-N6-dimethylallyladenosine synthase